MRKQPLSASKQFEPIAELACSQAYSGNLKLTGAQEFRVSVAELRTAVERMLDSHPAQLREAQAFLRPKLEALATYLETCANQYQRRIEFMRAELQESHEACTNERSEELVSDLDRGQLEQLENANDGLSLDSGLLGTQTNNQEPSSF